MKNIKALLKPLEGKIVFFATSSKQGKSNLICAEVNEILPDARILITNNMMKKTVKNIKENNFCSLAVYSKKISAQIKCSAKYYSKGKWLNYVKTLDSNKGYSPKGALILTVKQIFDLNSGKRIA
ncbi:MAG: pyridoxamine 5'-phosphate oxidase family protein [archaeon]